MPQRCYASASMNKKNTIDYVALLKPLFEAYHKKIEPAGTAALNLFKLRALERNVPSGAIDQLARFYSVCNGVDPCLDSLGVHRCDDMILFEWWQYRVLWLGGRDDTVLSWVAETNRFCIGSPGTYSDDAVYLTFGEALHHLVWMYPSAPWLPKRRKNR